MRYLLLSLLLIFVFCKNETTQNQTLVVSNPTALRDAPGEKSQEIRVLKGGEKLADLGAVSNFETQIRFGETVAQAPWLKVRTTDGQQGWVFAAAAKPTENQADWLLQKKMRCYFGEVLTARRNRFSAVGEAATEADFAARYREAVALRDTLMHTLARRAEPNEADFRPDFSWLPEVLPGFVFQKVAEGTQPYLFADYRFWQKNALQTQGGQDDAFIETCLAAFSADSIESFFPVWQFQFSDYEAASQLGTGQHLKMLTAIESALKAGPLFELELRTLRESLLEDILNKNSIFWQPKDLILKELTQILNVNSLHLGEQERTALQTRLTIFENPEANGVRVNLRSGE